MSKLMIALGSMMPNMAKKPCCPDCGGEMDGNECMDCGYGADDTEEEDEQAETQSLLDLKKQLQSAIELVDRMIVNNCD